MVYDYEHYMSNMSIFKKFKNHNWNKFIIKEKKRVSMLGESPCIIFISCNHEKKYIIIINH